MMVAASDSPWLIYPLPWLKGIKRSKRDIYSGKIYISKRKEKRQCWNSNALSLDARNDVNRDGSGLEPEATRRDPWPEMTRVSNYFAAGARRVAICIFRQYFEPSNARVSPFSLSSSFFVHPTISFRFLYLLKFSRYFINIWGFFFSLKKLLIRLIKKLVL